METKHIIKHLNLSKKCNLPGSMESFIEQFQTCNLTLWDNLDFQTHPDNVAQGVNKDQLHLNSKYSSFIVSIFEFTFIKL